MYFILLVCSIVSQQSRIKKIHYTELEYQSFESSQTFQKEISSSCVRPKRLITSSMIPTSILKDTSSANFGLNPMSSPFASEPATTSPIIFTGFNCSISNVNLY